MLSLLLAYVFILLFSNGFGTQWGFPGSTEDKVSACNVGDPDSIPGLGGSPGVEVGNPIQYSCLENPMDRGAWWTTVRGVIRVRHD